MVIYFCPRVFLRGLTIVNQVKTVVLSFQASATGGLGSVKAEVMADTAVALASANVQVVSRKVIGRLDSVRHRSIYLLA